MKVSVIRPYGGAEGKRVRVGTVFWVVRPGAKGSGPKGLQPISYDRYRELTAKGMLQDGVSDTAPARAAVTTPRKAPAKGGGRDPKGETERQTSQKKHKAGRGGQTGKAGAPSSLPVDPAPDKSGGLLGHRKRRGQRASDGSQSITPSDSAPGQTATTQQTGDGGGTTPAKSETGDKPTEPPFV